MLIGTFDFGPERLNVIQTIRLVRNAFSPTTGGSYFGLKEAKDMVADRQEMHSEDIPDCVTEEQKDELFKELMDMGVFTLVNTNGKKTHTTSVVRANGDVVVTIRNVITRKSTSYVVSVKEDDENYSVNLAQQLADGSSRGCGSAVNLIANIGNL